MANQLPDTMGLSSYREKRSQAKIERVNKMIQHSLEYNEPINVNLIAKKSGVSRWFIYSNPQLRETIDGLREVSLIRNRRNIEQQKTTASYTSNIAKIKTLQAQCLELKKTVERLTRENVALKEHIELKEIA